MVYCFAPGCFHSNDARTSCACTMHSFPSSTSLRRKWAEACRRADREPASYDVLCSCHFPKGDRCQTPCIFAWNAEKRFDFPTLQLRHNKRPAGTQMQNPPKKQKTEALPVHYSGCNNIGVQATDMKEKVRFDEMAAEIESLKEQLAQPRAMTLDEIAHDEPKMLHYTSLPYDVFLIIIKTLSRFPITYITGKSVITIPFQDQVLITFIKLKLNLTDLDLAHRFRTSHMTISNFFRTFIFAFHELFISGIMLHKGIPSLSKCQTSLPLSFRDFPSARVAMDATEITQDVPSNLNDQSVAYSSYKSRHTVKSVTCVAPNAALVYASPLYPGSISDVAIVEHCKLLKQFVPGDLILADKGFTLYNRLPAGVGLNIPPFLTGKAQFTHSEAVLSAKIARARIHVERANERMKNFSILSHIPAY